MIQAYISLTKPGIIMGNLITAAAGFALASHSHLDPLLLLATLAGLSCIIASACTCNNYIDRHSDAKMARTQSRPLPQGIISGAHALLFAAALLLTGSLLLATYTTLTALCTALLGFAVYVALYSTLKPHSTHATLIGSIAGAIPPVVGYTAVTGHLDLAALLLFLIVALWQMPHFFAIALYRLEDYLAAGIPVLPAAQGITSTKVQMLLYIIAFTIAALLPTLFGYTGYLYCTLAALVSLSWLWLCLKGFWSSNTTSWARQMFLFSLVVIMTFSLSLLCLQNNSGGV